MIILYKSIVPREILRLTLCILLFSVSLTSFNCEKPPEQFPEEKILAKIGDKVITVDDFKRRAEYTIRPPYCNGDNYIHRKIVLNSLIAEKLFAMETSENNELLKSEQFQDYLKGRQEQSLRQWLFYKDFYDKVELDTSEIKKMYKISAREYTVDYVSLKDSSIAREIGKHLQNGAEFDAVFAALDKIPQRKVTWESQENDVIHKALYSDLVEKGNVIGPLKIENDFYVVMRIAGYSDVRYLTDFDIRNRFRDFRERMTMDSAIAGYTQFVQKVMQGKRVDFNPDTFKKLVNIIGPLYMSGSKQKENAFNQKFWNKESDDVILDNVGSDIDDIADETLLKIDDEVWTVARFKKELNIHPLVFRKKRMKKSEFTEQFKYAIADMIRDKHIANEARKKGYDRSISVETNVNMWKDYLLGLYNRNEYLSAKGKLANFYENYLTIIEDDLNPHVREMQQKYSDNIQINTDLFEQIELSRIDMLAIQANVPFPIVVPNFPIVTTHDKLDYGSKIEIDTN